MTSSIPWSSSGRQRAQQEHLRPQASSLPIDPPLLPGCLSSLRGSHRMGIPSGPWVQSMILSVSWMWTSPISHRISSFSTPVPLSRRMQWERRAPPALHPACGILRHLTVFRTPPPVCVTVLLPSHPSQLCQCSWIRWDALFPRYFLARKNTCTLLAAADTLCALHGLSTYLFAACSQARLKTVAYWVQLQ